MKKLTVYDIAGIGVGPFNLGLAALCQPIAQLKTVFVDQKPEFNWHEGMMIPGTTLQVSYLADLVTLADPSSKYSYLNFLRARNRLLSFGIHEKSYITRSEYNRYCKWVCGGLDNVLFGRHVSEIFYNDREEVFEISTKRTDGSNHEKLYAKQIVIGTGTKPLVPQELRNYLGNSIIHSSQYMFARKRAIASKSIVVVGSGQSAGEIFYDLLNSIDNAVTRLSWCTRSDRFYAMEHAKLNYEMTSPDYIDFFYKLVPGKKEELLRKQFSLYKGINQELIDAIYDRLFDLHTEEQQHNIRICAYADLRTVKKRNEKEYELVFHHHALNECFGTVAEFIILATGYQYTTPLFLQPLKSIIRCDGDSRFLVNRNYSIDAENRIFIQNAEMHTHGFNAPDLGLGAYRNAVIINTILGQNIYPVDTRTCFQTFGVI